MGRIGILTAALMLPLIPCASAQETDLAAGIDPVVAAEVALPRLESRSLPKHTLESSTTSFSRIISLNYRLGERRSVGISTEFIKVASFYFEYDGFEEQPEWKFKGVPITLKYEHVLADPTRRIVPVVGVGVSYYLTQIKTRETNWEMVAGQSSELGPTVSTTSGMGWGAQATCGIRARLLQGVFLELQGRYRMVNGLEIMGHESDASRFRVFDFALGIGFEI